MNKMAYSGKLQQILNSHLMAFDSDYLFNHHSEKLPNSLKRNYQTSNLYKIIIKNGEAKVIDTSKTR